MLQRYFLRGTIKTWGTRRRRDREVKYKKLVTYTRCSVVLWLKVTALAGTFRIQKNCINT